MESSTADKSAAGQGGSGATEPGHAADEGEGPAIRKQDGPVVSTSRRTSLRERMKAHRAELEARTTEIFPIPLWGNILAVELKPVAWDETEEAMTRNSRQPDSVTYLTAMDEIEAGTVGFWEIDGRVIRPIEDADRWSDIAEAYNDRQLGDIPPTTRERVAIEDLCGDQGVMALSIQFRRWMGGAKAGISAEVERDFGTTT